MRAPRLSALITILLMAASMNAMADTPAYAGYPAPGGNLASGSGSGTTQSGGKTWSYSGFSPAAYGDLYYAVGSYSGSTFSVGTPALYEQSNPSSLSFNSGLSNLAQGVAVWSGSTQVPTTFGSTTLYTEFVLTVTGPAAQTLALDAPGAHGLAPAAGALLHVTGNFNANWQFLASTSGNAGTFTAAGPLYDNLSYKNPGDVLRNNVGGAFYATSPVPEPETYALLLAGLGLLGGVAGRRKARQS